MLESHDELVLYSLRLDKHANMDRVLKTIYTFRKSKGHWPKFYEIANRCRAFAPSFAIRNSVSHLVKEGYLFSSVVDNAHQVVILEKGYDRLRELVKIYTTPEIER